MVTDYFIEDDEEDEDDDPDKTDQDHPANPKDCDRVLLIFYVDIFYCLL